MFAVVRAGGKQYRVEEGSILTVDRLPLEPGVSLDLEVLAIGDGESLRVGTPRLVGATVTAEVLGEGRGKKVDVLRYKSKVRYRKLTGHRQRHVALRVTKISVD